MASVAQLVTGDKRLAKLGWDELAARLATRGHTFVLEDESDAADGEGREPREIAVALANLSRVTLPADAFAWFDGRKYDRYSTRAFLRVCGRALSAHRAALCRLETGDPIRWCVVVLPWADRDPAMLAARTAGHRIVSLGPRKPHAKLPAAKPPAAGLRRMKIAGSHHVYRRGTGDGLVLGEARGKSITTLLDVSTWPPRKRELARCHCERIGFARDGTYAIVGTSGALSTPRAERPIVFELHGDGDTIAIPPPPPDVVAEQLGFVGDDLVLLPSEPTYRGKHAQRPFAWRPGHKRWAPIDVPAVKVAKVTKRDFPAFCRDGFARTADEDLLLWEGGAYAKRRGRYVRVLELGDVSPYDELSNVADGDGCFVVAREAIVEARPGRKPVPRLAGIGRIDGIAAALDGAIVARLIRPRPTLPVLVAWWPASREYATVPAKLFGLTGKQWFTEHGVAAASRLAWGYEAITDDLRAISWDAIAALPRQPESAT